MPLTLTMVGIGKQFKAIGLNYFRHTETHGFRPIAFCVMLFALWTVSPLSAQEVLLPIRHEGFLQQEKDAIEAVKLPFFDDFSNPVLSGKRWQLKGTFVNVGFAPLPPTRGMATLDAFDAQGRLYPTATEQLFSCDTLESAPIRLDSIFIPYQRALSAADSVYLRFFYISGGGYGNMWERLGDCPEAGDSLVLEFYDAGNNAWDWIWSSEGISADTLFSLTGHYWQFQEICVLDSKYYNADFRFRFRNYCSLSDLNKKGLVSNADQWNIDYVRLDAGCSQGDTASRDVAFVEPAPSFLKSYQAMPAQQFSASEMKDELRLTIANLFSEELAAEYHYYIYNENGMELYNYDGGFENVPVYWYGLQYQTSAAHARPQLNYIFPISSGDPVQYKIVHVVREGVSGDAYASNDTTSFVQVFDNYYAYDDGTPENGYGITSTNSRVKVAVRFRLQVEDTLTALYMYFNRTLHDQNGDIRFAITVWDDADGVPGNIIYQDEERRRPRFEGFNQYVRYILENPVVCSGTIYVGFEQYSADYINLGFDRNHDASRDILYLTGNSWQTSILKGALMLRPYFGQRATLGVGDVAECFSSKVYAAEGSIVVETMRPSPIVVFNTMGQIVYMAASTMQNDRVEIMNLRPGLYFVKIGTDVPHKLFVN